VAPKVSAMKARRVGPSRSKAIDTAELLDAGRDAAPPASSGEESEPGEVDESGASDCLFSRSFGGGICGREGRRGAPSLPGHSGARGERSVEKRERKKESGCMDLSGGRLRG